jgi:ribosomal protein S18 acetylase RimI-like enzyme
MNTVEISDFTIADYDEALSLWERTPGMGLSSADERPAIAHFLSKNPGLCFVARLPTQHATPSAGGASPLVGTILCGSDGRRGYLYHLAVDLEQRNRRIGTELVSRSLEGLRLEGIVKCHLFVFATNEIGRAFWAGAGWQKRDDIITYSKKV